MKKQKVKPSPITLMPDAHKMAINTLAAARDFILALKVPHSRLDHAFNLYKLIDLTIDMVKGDGIMRVKPK